MITIEPLHGVPEVQPGDDLGALLAQAVTRTGRMLDATDVVVVTQKIVSKSEDRFVHLDEITPSEEARTLAAQVLKDPRLVELVLRESAAVVRAAPHVLITRHRLGMVMANAGIDASNMGPARDEQVLLLPVDPDASAAKLADALAKASGANGARPAVVISDSFGRPWRVGVVNVAIGASGLPALVDRRGDIDRDGRILQVTQIALADLMASAAGLAAGEGAESIPAVVLRGTDFPREDRPARDLVRPADQDLFR